MANSLSSPILPFSLITLNPMLVFQLPSHTELHTQLPALPLSCLFLLSPSCTHRHVCASLQFLREETTTKYFREAFAPTLFPYLDNSSARYLCEFSLISFMPLLKCNLLRLSLTTIFKTLTLSSENSFFSFPALSIYTTQCHLIYYTLYLFIYCLSSSTENT